MLSELDLILIPKNKNLDYQNLVEDVNLVSPNLELKKSSTLTKVDSLSYELHIFWNYVVFMFAFL